MDTKTLLIGGCVAVAAVLLWRKLNDAEKDAKNSDKQTENISDTITQQAVKLYNIISPSKVLGGWIVQIDTYPPSRVVAIYNVLCEVYNWAKVQDKFRALTGGDLTLLQALNLCLDSEQLNKALTIAAAAKIKTTAEAVVSLRDSTSEYGMVTKTFPANTIIGYKTSGGSLSTSFVNGYKRENWYNTNIVEITGTIDTKKIQII